MKLYRADLHIHTVLSPCTALAEMNPKAIVAQAVSRGLDIIAISDHNSAANAGAVITAAISQPLVVLPGMEITSREETHILGLFSSLTEALDMQELVYRHLPDAADQDMVSYQIETDVDNYVLNFNCKLLIGATDLSVEEVVNQIHRRGGLAIAAHIDREAYGIIGQLGFIPPDLPLDALEVSYRMSVDQARSSLPGAGQMPLVTSSDAHYLDDIGRASTGFIIEEASFEEMKKALQGVSGRGVNN